MDNQKLIIIPAYNQGKLLKKSLDALRNLNTSLLIIDDGSTDDTYDIIKDCTWLKYIKHESCHGYGTSFITGYEYARDFNFDCILIMDLNNNLFDKEIKSLMENINYGYDIVSSSRILENFDFQVINKQFIDVTQMLSEQLKAITGFDLTDPLSGIKAFRMDALKHMELTDNTHGIFLQLWIQANYFSLTINEIPAQSGNSFGEELALYDDPLGSLLAIIETEKYLYSKGNMN